MALFEDYEQKRQNLFTKIQSLQEFEKSDKVVNLVFEVSRQILGQPRNHSNAPWLLRKGSELIAYYPYLGGKANEAWGEYKAAEVAFKSVRDALVITMAAGKSTITEAKAEAGRASVDAEIDVIAREQKSKNYAMVADTCDRMVSFIQSTVRQIEAEKAKVSHADRGR